MPSDEVGFGEESVERLFIGNQLTIKVTRVPVVKDVADVENDGGRTQSPSPGAP